ncbi:response regulator containing a CheY-like receiver domain and an HTH DNA-binding domain [Burkholderiales bacterium JOSHI_001]|nr:response regulator containing a CheY-like receiver domain and an HTH DNA-binding domain [Burkholderiales bacterium JOSHI_001]
MRLAPERMSVLLVDDHPLFCDALAMLCERHWPGMRVRSCGTLAQALVAVHAAQPSLLLLDLGLPDAQGLDALRQLRLASPDTPLVVLSADERTQTVTAAIEAGAAGFIAKTANATQMCGSLQTVLDGGVCVPAGCLGDVHAAAAQRHAGADAGGWPHAQDHELSARQVDVLRLLVQGKPNKAISRELALSESTVKTHVAAVFRKLGVSNRTQAVLAAARLGLRLNRT